MTIGLFTFLLFLGSIAAGFIGSLTGLGGGLVLVPLLTVAFGVDLKYAIGVALISVIATSSGAASAYVKEGFSNVRIGMFLEVATTIGAICGVTIGLWLNAKIISCIFGVVLIYSAYSSNKRQTPDHGAVTSDYLATKLRMNGSFPTPTGEKHYQVTNVPGGFVLMWIAGVLSGMLGIGSGAVKVLAMDQVMRIPYKASTTTSNFMIGVTAAASAGIYLHAGYIVPGLALPVVLGALIGSMTGAKILYGMNTQKLRLLFTIVILFMGVQMVYHSLQGAL